MSKTIDAAASPCISICVLDDKDMCLGCYRTTDEIGQWREATLSGKNTILGNAEKRKQEYER